VPEWRAPQHTDPLPEPQPERRVVPAPTGGVSAQLSMPPPNRLQRPTVASVARSQVSPDCRRGAWNLRDMPSTPAATLAVSVPLSGVLPPGNSTPGPYTLAQMGDGIFHVDASEVNIMAHSPTLASGVGGATMRAALSAAAASVRPPYPQQPQHDFSADLGGHAGRVVRFEMAGGGGGVGMGPPDDPTFATYVRLPSPQ
jgi:hypothetical protein